MTSQGRFEKAKAWIDRTDPAAQQLSAVDVDQAGEERRAETLQDLARESVLGEYRSCGIDPVYADQDHTMIVSLSMLVHNGWRIEQMSDGARKLVR